jgi:hypothetical protein
MLTEQEIKKAESIIRSELLTGSNWMAQKGWTGANVSMVEQRLRARLISAFGDVPEITGERLIQLGDLKEAALGSVYRYSGIELITKPNFKIVGPGCFSPGEVTLRIYWEIKA